MSPWARCHRAVVVAAAALAVGAQLSVAGCAREGAAAAPVEGVLAGERASTPTVALGPGGQTAYVAWVEQGEGGGDVLLARLGRDGRRLADPVRVNDLTADADPHEQAPPQVRVAPDGGIYVLWQKKVPVPWLPFGASELRFARSLDGGATFQPAISLGAADGPPARRTFHDLAVAPDGTIHVSWIDAGMRDAVRSERAAAEGDGAGRSARAHGSGGVHHHAAGGTEPGTRIHVASSRDGGLSFGPATVVDENSCPCCRTSIAVGPDGTVYVAYRKIFPGDVRDVAIVRSEDGGRTFSAPVPVHQDGWVFPGCPHAGPSIVVDGRGTVHAAWYTGREGNQGIFHASSADGGRSFGAPAALAAGEWMPPSHVRLAADGDGAWAVWDDRREAPDVRPVRMARLEDGRSPRLVAGTEYLVGGVPDVAAGSGARVLARLADGHLRVRILD
jgi:hypothetical protein